MVVILQMKEIKPRMTYGFAPGPRATPQPLFSASWEMQRCWENRGGHVLSAHKIHFLGQSGSFGKYKDSFSFQQALTFGFKFVNVCRTLCSEDRKVVGPIWLHIALLFSKQVYAHWIKIITTVIIGMGQALC